LWLPVAGACLSIACAIPATAAGANDTQATSAYVQANYAVLRVARSHLKVSENAPLEVLATVRQQCPKAGASSPQNPESTQMSNEVIGAMVLDAGLPDRAAVARFVRTVAGLRWSSGGLTRAIRSYTGKLKTLDSMSPPNLCADVRAWAADGYRSLPPTTASFSPKFMSAWVALGSMPSGLSASETGSTRALARRAERIEEELAEAEARAVEHWGGIMNALEIWP
jgi:hypothetical protein